MKRVYRTIAVLASSAVCDAGAQLTSDSVTARTPRPPAEQIASAVLPAPRPLRDGATVLGYDSAGHLTSLRRGAGELVCLASDPRSPRFHVACYHRSLEPFMARGRALRAAGVVGPEVDSVRFREARAGKLRLPRRPAALYSLTAPAGSYDTASGEIRGARALYVVYIPYATARSTGISAEPIEGAPWIMFPGTPKAHLMFVPKM
ncbi:MAG: hypothetical protein NVS4B3_23360 [Gemmatimonadaceae bacterium]